MSSQNHSAISQKLMLSFQKDEVTSAKIYDYFAKVIKDKQEQETLRRIAQDELSHAKIWQQYTGKEAQSRIPLHQYLSRVQFPASFLFQGFQVPLP